MIQRLSSGLIKHKPQLADSVGSILRDRLNQSMYPSDFLTFESLASAMAQSNNAFEVRNSTNTFLLTVGAGGHYSNLRDALAGAAKMRPHYADGQGYCEIRLKSGFILSEQIEFTGGADLSWIKITSEDAVVSASTAGFTKKVRHYYEYKYMFRITDGVRSPIFAFLAEENRNDSDVAMYMVTREAHLNFWPGAGGRKFYVGVDATFGAWVHGYHTGAAPDDGSVGNYLPAGYFVVDFSESRRNAVMAISSYISLPLSKFDKVTEEKQPSVTCIFGTVANFQGSSASYCYIGWNIRDAATVNIRDHMTTHCTYRGLSCIHGVFVDARRHDVEEVDIATSGKVFDANKQLGFYGCALGVRVDGAGLVDLAGNDMRNCGTTINCDNGAVVSAKGLDVSGATVVVFSCQGDSKVVVPRLWAQNVKKFCLLKYRATVTSRWANIQTGSTFEQDSRFFDIDYNSFVSLTDSKVDGDVAMFAGNLSELAILGKSVIKVRAFRSFTGSRICLAGITYDPAYARAISDAELQFRISQGGTIYMNPITISDGSTPQLSKSENIMSDAGIIFR